MAFANNMDRDQTPRNVGPNPRSILVDTQYKMSMKTDLNSEDSEILSILNIVPVLEGTVTVVYVVSAMTIVGNTSDCPNNSTHITYNVI